MGYNNFLLKLLVVLYFYVSLNTYVNGYKMSIYSFNVNYCVDKKDRKISKSNIEAGLKMISKRSCINFLYKLDCKSKKKPKQKNTKKSLPFIRFLYNRKKYTSNYYFNGSISLMRTIVYNMEIDVICNKRPGCIAKKVMMYLGLIPTVRRKDRNDYIIINDHDIEPEYRKQYSLLPNVPLYTGYDYSSIAHFPDNYRALPNKKTYARKLLDDERVRLTGQEIRPIFSDLKWLYHAYCKKYQIFSVNCQNMGFPKSDGSNECECPTGYSGQTCNEIQFDGKFCPPKFNYIATKSNKQELHFKSNANCTVELSAPEGKRIRISILETNCESSNPCFENNCLQIKYQTDMSITGLCLCGVIKDTALSSQGNKALIQYIGKHRNNYARIEYYFF